MTKLNSPAILKRYSRKILGFVLFFSITGNVLAQAGNPPRITDIQLMILRIIDILYGLGGIFFLIMAVAIGITYMTSAGDPEKVQEARTRLMYLGISFAIYFLSATIVTTIYSVFDVTDCMGETVKPGFTFLQQSCNEKKSYLDRGNAGNVNDDKCVGTALDDTAPLPSDPSYPNRYSGYYDEFEGLESTAVCCATNGASAKNCINKIRCTCPDGPYAGALFAIDPPNTIDWNDEAEVVEYCEDRGGSGCSLGANIDAKRAAAYVEVCREVGKSDLCNYTFTIR